MMIDVNVDLPEPATAHLFSLFSQLLQIGVRGEEECQCSLVSKKKEEIRLKVFCLRRNLAE